MGLMMSSDSRHWQRTFSFSLICLNTGIRCSSNFCLSILIFLIVLSEDTFTFVLGFVPVVETK